MKRFVLLGVIALSLGFAGAGIGSPMQGMRSLGDQKLESHARGSLTVKFRGGERACVIVKGDHDPVVRLGLSVYDDKGTLVAKDDAGGDYVAVIWYPPRDGAYKIEIFNPGATWNRCYISLK